MLSKTQLLLVLGLLIILPAILAVHPGDTSTGDVNSGYQAACPDNKPPLPFGLKCRCEDKNMMCGFQSNVCLCQLGHYWDGNDCHSILGCYGVNVLRDNGRDTVDYTEAALNGQEFKVEM